MFMPPPRPAARSFRDLLVWRKAHEFVLAVYTFTSDFPKQETYGLSQQLRRAAVSIPANIAEGFRRRGKPDKARFMNLAEGSLEECRYYLILAHDLGYGDTVRLTARRWSRRVVSLEVVQRGRARQLASDASYGREDNTESMVAAAMGLPTSAPAGAPAGPAVLAGLLSVPTVAAAQLAQSACAEGWPARRRLPVAGSRGPDLRRVADCGTQAALRQPTNGESES